VCGGCVWGGVDVGEFCGGGGVRRVWDWWVRGGCEVGAGLCKVSVAGWVDCGKCGGGCGKQWMCGECEHGVGIVCIRSGGM
jgi:hypothetical protein